MIASSSNSNLVKGIKKGTHKIVVTQTSTVVQKAHMRCRNMPMAETNRSEAKYRKTGNIRSGWCSNKFSKVSKLQRLLG